MIIHLRRDHPAAKDLEDAAALLRRLKRGMTSGVPEDFDKALYLTETHHGNSNASYQISPGSAGHAQSIAAYRYIKANFPHALDILAAAMKNRAVEVTITVGHLGSNTDIHLSEHERLTASARILALLRGTISSF